MSVPLDIRQIVDKYSALPLARLRIVQRFDDLQSATIRRGIAFVFATWSGPAVSAFRYLTSTLSHLELDSMDIVVIDNKCLTADNMIQLAGHVFHGYGETMWIRDGRVIAELSSASAETQSLIVKHTQDLLDDRDTR